MRKNGGFEARFQTENLDLFDVGKTLNCDNLTVGKDVITLR